MPFPHLVSFLSACSKFQKPVFSESPVTRKWVAAGGLGLCLNEKRDGSAIVRVGAKRKTVIMVESEKRISDLIG